MSVKFDDHDFDFKDLAEKAKDILSKDQTIPNLQNQSMQIRSACSTKIFRFR
jgi:hypothetical protein